jgi:orotate phosphoribosyltransferase
MAGIVELLKQAHALITDDHFVYTSGKHGSVYINKDALYPHTEIASDVGKMMAEKFRNENIDVVVAPALGGIVLSQWVAHHLSAMQRKEILGVYAEKDSEKNLIFTRGYDKLVKEKNVLVIEDITNTGGSLQKVIQAVKDAGGIVVAACVMVNRDPKNVTSVTMGAPLDALGVLPTEIFDAPDCPLCKENVPINTEVGHGSKYLSQKSS